MDQEKVFKRKKMVQKFFPCIVLLIGALPFTIIIYLTTQIIWAIRNTSSPHLKASLIRGHLLGIAVSLVVFLLPFLFIRMFIKTKNGKEKVGGVPPSPA